MFTKGKVSSYVEFSQRVAGSGWSKRLIKRKFLKQVDKADYAKSDVGQIVNYLAVRAHQVPKFNEANSIGEILLKAPPRNESQKDTPVASPYPLFA